MQDCYLTFFLTELAGATVMIFTRTCDNTRKLALMLRNLGFDALPIHGQMSQPKRLGALNKFKGGDRNILVATGETPSSPVGLRAAAKCTSHENVFCRTLWLCDVPSPSMPHLQIFSTFTFTCAVCFDMKLILMSCSTAP